MNWSSLDGAQKRPQNGTDRRKGWGRDLPCLPLCAVCTARWTAGAPKPLRPTPGYGTREALLAKSSSRVWKPDSRGGYPPRIAGGFVALFMGALYPEHPCFHCIVYGAVMREASCLPVPRDRFSTPHDCPFFYCLNGKGGCYGASEQQAERHRFQRTGKT